MDAVVSSDWIRWDLRPGQDGGVTGGANKLIMCPN